LLATDTDVAPDGAYEMAVFDSAGSAPLAAFERFRASLADRALVVFCNAGDEDGDVMKGIETLIAEGQIEGVRLSTPRGIFVGSLKSSHQHDHS
jgi:hypothetical protein